jgi:hypothetical protein
MMRFLQTWRVIIKLKISFLLCWRLGCLGCRRTGCNFVKLHQVHAASPHSHCDKSERRILASSAAASPGSHHTWAGSLDWVGRDDAHVLPAPVRADNAVNPD